MGVMQAESDVQVPVAAASLGCRQELERAFEGSSAEQLQETALRLSRGTAGLNEVLSTLESDGAALREESKFLGSSIEMVMKELRKLNIGSANLVEPQLEEGPIAFVLRHWEKVKPRDSAHQTSEHVGEIRKPLPSDEPGSAQDMAQEMAKHARQQVVHIAQRIHQAEVAQQAGQQVAQAGQQVAQMVQRLQKAEVAQQAAQHIQGALGPWWMKTRGFISEKQHEISGRYFEAKQRQPQQQRQQDRKPRSSKGRRQSKEQQQQQLKPQPQEPQPQPHPPCTCITSEEAAAAAGIAEAGENAGLMTGVTEAATAASTLAEAESPSAAPAAATAPTAGKGTEHVAEGASTIPDEVAKEVSAKEEKEEEVCASTILIEARLKVPDGSVLTLHVRPVDRCREVAQHFVQEHSLKAWFQDPLTAWLKQVESDAEAFPVSVEGDLTEIRKQFSKSRR